MAGSHVAGSSSVSSGGAGVATSFGGTNTMGGASTMGGANTIGGAEALAGAMAMGGMNVALGGDASDSGEAGTPGAGGAAACVGYLHACGCGCCGGQPSPATCVYPDLGQDLTELTAQEANHGPGNCAFAVCGVGHDYFCCAAPPPSNDGATYEASQFIGGINRVRLHKMLLPQECSTFELQQAAPTAPADPQAFPVNVPVGWKIESIRTLPCSSSAIGPNAIGAIGDFSLHVVNGACVMNAHLTAFFGDAQLGLRSVRFDADGVPVNISAGECK